MYACVVMEQKSAVSAMLAAANGSDDNAVLPDFTFITSNGAGQIDSRWR